MPRDDFSAETKTKLAKRVGYKCSNPNCRRITIGPKEGEDEAINIGVAAHITAAAPKGPRYDSTMTKEQRSDFKNGIWLCENCSHLIDNDVNKYTVNLLHQWKINAERRALEELTLTSSMSKEELVKETVFVKNWISYPDIQSNTLKIGMRIMIDKLGGVVKKGDRWINYIDTMEDWEKPYLEAIRIDVINRGIKMSGAEHQNLPNGTPEFNNGKVAIFSYRAWGDLMAAIWSEVENTNYSYLDFYM